MSHSTIIVFTRYPKPGQVKTRLIPRLGPAGAARLYKKMAEDIFNQASLAAQKAPARLEVHYSGATVEKMKTWLGNGPIYVAQADSPDLGSRMARALDHALAAGATKAILIGCDIQALTSDHLIKALAALEGSDAVFGPATDGGYWLVGLKASQPGLFTNIAWSTSQTLAESLARAAEMGLSVARIETLSDLDRPEDIDRSEDLNLRGQVQP